MKRIKLSRPIRLSKGQAPSELVIWPLGVSETSKGKFLIDERALKLMEENFRQTGHDAIPFDLGHGMTSSGISIESQQAYAWGVPVFDKERGVVATEIDWTEQGRDLVESKKVRYWSPTFTVELTDDGAERVTIQLEDGSIAYRPVDLLTVSLTNLPATYGQLPIAADRNVPGTMCVLSEDKKEENSPNKEISKMDEEQLKKFDEMSAQLSDILARLEKLEGADKDEEKQDDEEKKDEGEELSHSVESETQVELAKAQERISAMHRARIDDLVQTGRLTPANRPFAEKLSVELFEEFVQQLPKIQLGKSTIVPIAPAQEDPEFIAASNKLRSDLAKRGIK